MPRVIPTLGYPTRTEAVLALDAQGLAPMEIAGRIGAVSSNSVRVILAHARNGRRRQKMARTVVVAVDALDRLRVYADARGISVNELVRRLIDHALDDDLVDGILDDGAEA